MISSDVEATDGSRYESVDLMTGGRSLVATSNLRPGTLSPSGEQLATYFGDTYLFSSKLEIASVQGTATGPPRVLWTLPDDVVGGPALNRAGTKVALALTPSVTRMDITGPNAVPPSVWVIDATNGYRARVVDEAAGDVAWSADGKTLAFVELQDNGGTPVGLATVPAAGGKVHRILELDGDGADSGMTVRTSVSWSRDGRTVLVSYPSSAIPGTLGQQGSAILAVPAVGGTPVRIFLSPQPFGIGVASYSPDGQHIVYTTLTNGTSSLVVTDPDGGGRRTLFTLAKYGGFLFGGWLGN